MSAKLVVVGGGKMGSALVGGLLSSGWATATQIVVVDPVPAARERLVGVHPGLTAVASLAELAAADAPVGPGAPGRPGAPGGTGAAGGARDAVLAVKPSEAAAAAAQATTAGISRVLSIAAGVTTSRLEMWLGGDAVVVRAMPNTPALVGRGVAAISAGTRASAEDLEWARGILGSVGSVVIVAEESMDAVTGVSGSGPAYFFLVVEALTQAAVEVGVEPEMAALLARGTFVGAARLLEETGEAPEELRAAVTSPGGTTAAGVAVLEDSGIFTAFADAVRAAKDRSEELGQG